MGIKRRQEADFRRVAEERGRGGGRERDPEGTSPAESGKNLQAEETAEQRLYGGQRAWCVRVPGTEERPAAGWP